MGNKKFFLEEGTRKGSDHCCDSGRSVLAVRPTGSRAGGSVIGGVPGTVGRMTVTTDSVIMCYSEKSSRGCRVDCLGVGECGGAGGLAAFAAVASFGAAPV